MRVKKLFAILLAAVMLCAMAACSQPTSEAESTPAPTAEPTKTVAFADPLLEKMVRAAMNKPEGGITLAEAEAVTELQLGIDWQQEPAPNSQITDISGLEYFTNLEDLNLAFHAITDITPLAGLTKLRQLSLGGNPVADISPLAGLTNLGSLTLFNAQAQDYTPLANLKGLGMLLLEHSTISDVSMLSGLTELWWLGLANTQVSDVSPLAGLINLRQLQLAGCPINDYTPLAAIYPNLEKNDFSMVSSLKELGFTFNDGDKLALYETDEYDIRLNHGEWGNPPQPDWQNCIRVIMGADSGYKNAVGFYPVHNTYVVWMFNPNTDENYTYVYDAAENSFGCERADMEPIVREAFGDSDGEDILLTPVAFFDITIEEALGIPVDALYALPWETLDKSSLTGLGFTADEDTASYFYESNGERYFNVQILNPEWGNWDDEEGGDVKFFTPLSDEYRVVIRYFAEEKKYLVKADDNSGSGASFEFFVDRDEHIDGWCGTEGMTVEEYFKNAYNDPAIDDIYHYSIKLMERCIGDAFSLGVEELCALPFEKGGRPAASENSLMGLGFGFDDAGTCGVYEQREPHYASVAIARPEWGEFPDDWNIELIDTDVNGYSLRVTYHPNGLEYDPGKIMYHISADKNDGTVSASYDYYPATGEYGGYPDDVPAVFNAVFGTQGDSFRDKPLAHFEQWVMKLFGKSIDELYALPIR